VMDNYGTHKVAKVRKWLARHPRYHVHFTPTGGSWLNVVERLFAEVTERCVRRDSHTSIRLLQKAMLDYLDARNEHPRPFVWTADAETYHRTQSTMISLSNCRPLNRSATDVGGRISDSIAVPGHSRSLHQSQRTDHVLIGPDRSHANNTVHREILTRNCMCVINIFNER
jgi:hypothetical protein